MESFLFAVVLEGETNKHDAHINIHKAQLNKNEERFKLLEGACYNGKLIWKVTDYKMKKREALDGHTVSIFSQPFYTSRFVHGSGPNKPETGTRGPPGQLNPQPLLGTRCHL